MVDENEELLWAINRFVEPGPSLEKTDCYW